MRIIVICHYFPPELGAASYRVFEMARVWAAAGHAVTAVTGFPNHPTGVIPPQYRGRLTAEEDLDGVRVLRNWVYATPNQGFVRRTLGHLAFTLSAVLFSLRRSGAADVVLVSSPTLFSAIAAWCFSRVKRAPLVLEVRDLWPAALVDLGLLRPGLVYRLLVALELWLYRVSKKVVLVTHAFRDNLARRGVPADKLAVITAGVDVDFFVPGPRENDVRRELGLQGKFVAAYAGALGISHALSRLLAAAQLLQGDPDFHLLIVGEGAEKAQLRAEAAALQLKNVTFLDGQPKERMPAIWAAADAALVPLRDVPLFATFIPSKMFEIMACERPIVASLRGEAAEILEAAGGAIVVPPEDSAAIAQALAWLKANPDQAAAMARRGHVFAVEQYSRKALAHRYLDILQTAREARR